MVFLGPGQNSLAQEGLHPLPLEKPASHLLNEEGQGLGYVLYYATSTGCKENRFR